MENKPAQQPTAKTIGTGGAVKGLFFLSVSLITAIGIQIGTDLTDAEGDVRKPYKDVAGIWTVCKGITGKDVIIGKTYTADECRRLETAYIERMVSTLGTCINKPLSFDEWVVYGHFAYNVGTKGFCSSTLVKKLNDGDRIGACKQMARFDKYSVPLNKIPSIKGSYKVLNNRAYVYCRDPKNRCMGLPNRRDAEVSSCLNAVSAN